MSVKTNYLITYLIYRLENLIKDTLTILGLIVMSQDYTRLGFTLIMASFSFWCHFYSRIWRNSHHNHTLQIHVIDRCNHLAKRRQQLKQPNQQIDLSQHFDIKAFKKDWKHQLKKNTHECIFIKHIFNSAYQISHLRITTNLFNRIHQNYDYYAIYFKSQPKIKTKPKNNYLKGWS